jgi:hypothetical protein
MIIIETYGRFGNNIQQLIHAIHVAKHLKISTVNFTISGFHINRILLGAPRWDEPKLKHTFFKYEDLHSIHPDCKALPELPFTTVKSYAMTYLYPLLKYRPGLFKDMNLDPKTTLCIHVRSGDIFHKNPHPDYIPPPLDFYKKSIQSQEWKNILVVYQDDKNPVVHALKKEFPSAYFSSLSLEKTISVFLEAEFIVASIGSFVPIVLLFNTEYKELYLPEYATKGLERMLCSEKLKCIKLPDYVEIWENTEGQRKRILEYQSSSA